MKLITQRELIREVAAKWRAQYPVGGAMTAPDKEAIYRRLAALDGETAKAHEVDDIIGNDSWTTIACNECERWTHAAVIVGAPEDYGSSTAYLCADCVRGAFSLMGLEP